MTCCVLKSSVVACSMSGESVPLATGEGCRVLFCYVLFCIVLSCCFEFCIEAFLHKLRWIYAVLSCRISSGFTMFRNMLLWNGFISHIPNATYEWLQFVSFVGVMFCLVMFGLFGFIGVISCILADVQARKYECFHIIWYAYQQCVECVMLCRLLSCQDLFRQMLYLPIMFSYLIGKCEGWNVLSAAAKYCFQLLTFVLDFNPRTSLPM